MAHFTGVDIHVESPPIDDCAHIVGVLFHFRNCGKRGEGVDLITCLSPNKIRAVQALYVNGHRCLLDSRGWGTGEFRGLIKLRVHKGGRRGSLCFNIDGHLAPSKEARRFKWAAAWIRLIYDQRMFGQGIPEIRLLIEHYPAGIAITHAGTGYRGHESIV
jgi:hypothetical protein